MLSAKVNRKLTQIIPFGLISMLFGLVYAFIEHGVLGDYPSYPSTGNPYFFNPLLAALLSLFAGICIGSIEVFVLNRVFEKRSFYQKIIYKTLIYMLMISALILIISVAGHALELRRSPFDKEVLSFGLNFFSSFAFLSIEIYMALGVGFALFYLEISDNIGLGVLNNFFIGKYHRPIEENRIFMFLDMKDSTAIAEKLGHVRYFEMLREYYADLTRPIINYSGEIYQYVGDEVVVTWKEARGIDQNNCLLCFFAMKEALNTQSAKYIATYGLAPTFKAGMHLGQVTTGEIGVIKKDIVFTGDVLNTTARIQGLCNQYATDLLISEQLSQVMDVKSDFSFLPIGKAELRGRNEKVNLFTVEKS